MKTSFFLAILLTFLCASNLFAQNKGENVMESVSENKLINAVFYKDITEVEKVLAEGIDSN